MRDVIEDRRGTPIKAKAWGKMIVPVFKLVHKLDGYYGSVDLFIVGYRYRSGAASNHTTHRDFSQEVRLGIVWGDCGVEGLQYWVQEVALNIAKWLPSVMYSWEKDPIIEFPNVAFRHIDMIAKFPVWLLVSHSIVLRSM
jgi:hypothetical protein